MWIFQIKYYNGILFTYPIPIKDDTQKKLFSCLRKGLPQKPTCRSCFFYQSSSATTIEQTTRDLQPFTLPETNMFASENGWLEDFLVSFWGPAYFQGLFLGGGMVLGSVKTTIGCSNVQIPFIFQTVVLDQNDLCRGCLFCDTPKPWGHSEMISNLSGMIFQLYLVAEMAQILAETAVTLEVKYHFTKMVVPLGRC